MPPFLPRGNCCRSGIDLVFAAARVKKVQKVLGDEAVGMATVTRLALSLRFGQIGPFLGRNALSILEAFPQCKRSRTHKWIRERGSMMGPGASRGGNLLMGRWQTLHTDGRSLPKQLENFGKMPSYIRKLQELVRTDLDRIRQLLPDVKDCLEVAAESLLADSDTTAVSSL